MARSGVRQMATYAEAHSSLPANVHNKMDELILNYKDLEARLLGGEESEELRKQIGTLRPVAELAETTKGLMETIDSTHEELGKEQDEDIRGMYEEDISNYCKELLETEKILLAEFLKNVDSDCATDDRNAILEIRAGTGGAEAALFVADLFNMYKGYADLQGWRFEPMECDETMEGGYRNASAQISGDGIFGQLKHESGVHRVQRVPSTEAKNRVHTSAVSVAIMPEAEEVDVEVRESDLRIDTYRASGAGGQHVNTTESAVRVTHIPTGIVVCNQDQRSQHKNKAKAIHLLRAKLFDQKLEKARTDRHDNRQEQMGRGDRSERIRTYNFPQGRCTDHRVGLTINNLAGVMSGLELGQLISELDKWAKLEAIRRI